MPINQTTSRKDSLDDTRKFHRAFGQGIPPCPCVNTNDDAINLYEDLMQEELTEFRDAMEFGDEAEILDAVADMQVILDGIWIQTGFHVLKDEAMREVFKSNMSKLGADGKPIYREDGKILKGPNYFKPDFKRVINEWQKQWDKKINAKRRNKSTQTA